MSLRFPLGEPGVQFSAVVWQGMYDPSPFLITTGALTSIYTFFFGEYFREREAVYRLWLRVFAYGWRPETPEERTELCAQMESKDRMYRQGKAFLLIMLITLIACFATLQGYSWKYIHPVSEFYAREHLRTYWFFTAITGLIVLINCIELMYIRVAVQFRFEFPFIRLRRRVTAQQRLSMLWQVLGCPECKQPPFHGSRIPARFYRDMEDPGKVFGASFIVNDPDFDAGELFRNQEKDVEDNPPKKE